MGKEKVIANPNWAIPKYKVKRESHPHLPQKQKKLYLNHGQNNNANSMASTTKSALYPLMPFIAFICIIQLYIFHKIIPPIKYIQLEIKFKLSRS